ncbi:MAG: sensor histidine kinase [Spirochaetota bacterium]
MILNPLRRALRGASLYGVVALGWILVSDWLLFTVIGFDELSILLGTVKGIVFVLFTATLLFFLLRQNIAEAQRLSEYQRALIDAAPLAVFDLDAEGRVRSLWNAAAERVFGFSAEEAIGRLLPSLSDDQGEELTELRRRVFAGESITGLEVRHLRRDGKTVTVLLGTAPVRNSRGVVDTSVSVVADISDRKAVEVSLEDSLRDKKALLQEVHHRVKNNLQVILSLIRIQVAQRDSDPASRPDNDLEQLRRRVRTIAVVHDQLSKPEDLRGIDLRRCLYDVAADFRSAVADRGHNLEIRIDAPAWLVSLNTAVPAMLLAGELIDVALENSPKDQGKAVVEVFLDPTRDPFSITVCATAAGSNRRTDPKALAPAESLAAQIGCTLVCSVDGGKLCFVAEGAERG